MEMKLFAPGSANAFGLHVADMLGIGLAHHEERQFEDGEHKFRPLECVRGEDVYILADLFFDANNSINDRLIQSLFFLGAVRDAGAAKTTVIAPYLPYSRKDRRTKSRDPLTTRYIAQLFEAMNIDTIVTIDVHNISAFENAFRAKTVHLNTREVFSARLRTMVNDEAVVVASPDPGGVKRAQLFRETLEAGLNRAVGFSFLEKRRSADVVSGDMMAGEVDNATVLIVDDMISSGGTMARAANAFRQAGARKIYALATHGLFSSGAACAIDTQSIDQLLISDTVSPARVPERLTDEKVDIVSVIPLIADAIRQLCKCGSVNQIVGGAP